MTRCSAARAAAHRTIRRGVQRRIPPSRLAVAVTSPAYFFCSLLFSIYWFSDTGSIATARNRCQEMPARRRATESRDAGSWHVTSCSLAARQAVAMPTCPSRSTVVGEKRRAASGNLRVLETIVQLDRHQAGDPWLLEDLTRISTAGDQRVIGEPMIQGKRCLRRADDAQIAGYAPGETGMIIPMRQSLIRPARYTCCGNPQTCTIPGAQTNADIPDIPRAGRGVLLL